MKSTLLVCVAMLFSSIAISQNAPNQQFLTDRPDLIIKADELKNFPGGQLIEMLLGRLPGLDHMNVQIQENEIVFLVDGFIWQSIDAIPIHNIEEIAYYRGGLSAKLGVQNGRAAAGVIVITTKTSKFRQPISAEINVLLGNNSFEEELMGGKRSTLQRYHMVLSQGLEQFSWRASAVYNKASRNLTGYDFTDQLQLNGDVRFAPVQWLELGLNANYAPTDGVAPVKRIGGSYDLKVFENKVSLDNWNGLFNIKLKPLKGLLNEVSILKNNNSSDVYTKKVTNNGNEQFTSEDLGSIKFNSLSLMNNLSYRLGIAADKIKFKAVGIFQYNDLKIDQEILGVNYIGPNSQLEMTMENAMWSRMKFYVFGGDLTVNLYNLLSIQAGVRGDKYKGSSEKPLYAPFYYADLNLKQAFLQDVAAVNEFRFYSSYGQYRCDVEVQGLPDNFGYDFMPGVPNNNALNLSSEKMKMQNYGIKTVYFGDRLHLSGDWYQNDSYIYWYINVPGAGGMGAGTTFLLPVKNTGWRLWASANAITNSKFKWNTGFNLFKNNTVIKQNLGAISSFDVKFENKPALQAGMQQGFSYANLSLNLNGSAYFDHPLLTVTNSGNGLQYHMEESTFVNLNYLSLGYRFKKEMIGAVLKNVNISLVARNIGQYKKRLTDATMSRTIGLAINANL
uniref:hypothetical protein n=1 Tax=Pedobacter schmidteae TaxID=2201271 RepID=UPI0013CEBBE1|nr:hypothetical protein [Pedobacter schmidteae]